MDRLRFHLNGRPVEESGVSPTTTLLRYLRDRQGLSGTKEGCAEGDCGACTVAVLEPRADGKPTYRAVNSCLVLLPMLQGKQVFTVEALKSEETYHPVQESMARHLGSQCGYCTPGVVMSLFEAAYREDLTQPEWQIDDQMCGNLCRCTGYRPIRDAAKELAGTCPKDRFAEALERPAQEPMALNYSANGQRYFNPATLGELLDTVAEHPSARFVCGGTDLSLEVTKRFQEPEILVSTEGVPELRQMQREDGGWRFGAAVTLTQVQEKLAGSNRALEKMIRFFASRQIKNRASLGGNLCNASPIGDMAPVLIALGAQATIASKAGLRTIPLEEFFLAYRKTALERGEVLHSIFVPDLGAGELASSFKVSKRRELDISAVSAGCWVRLVEGRVVSARLAFGGMAATPARARHVEQALVGKPWTRESVEAAMGQIDLDFKPLSDHRGSAWYRGTVAKNLVLGFFLETQEGSDELQPRPTATVQLEVRR